MTLKFEETLISEGFVTAQDILKIKAAHKKENTTFTQQLISSGIVNKNNIIRILEKKFNITFFDLETKKINYKAAILVPKELAEKYCMFPVDLIGNTIYVAMSDPFNFEAIENIKFSAGREVYAYFSDKDQISVLIDRFYSRQSTERVLENFRNTDAKIELSEKDGVQYAPGVTTVDYIIEQSILLMASDIHIEPFENHVSVRVRIDGKLSELIRLPIDILHLVTSRVKVLGNLEIVEKRVPQDGKFQKIIKAEVYDFRVSIVPTIFGEKTVIRVLYKNSINMNFNSLGFHEGNISIIERILLHSSGLVLITGPTGSGKSTTLYAILNYLNKKDINIVTVEDPVEFFIQGVNQINVNHKIGLNFASGLRAILRQDPDVIMVGEIRDNETAEMAVRAAVTGHLVISTLHTRDSASSITRLRDMQVQSYLLSDALVAVVAQRLVRKICTFCKAEYILTEKERSLIKPEYKIYKGKGCYKCSNTGYLGRRAIYEILYLDEKQKRLISSDSSVEEIREFSFLNGTVSLKNECLSLLKAGDISLEEYIKLKSDC